MILMIIYLLGLIPGFIAMLDVWHLPTLQFFGKLGLGLAVLLFSWFGYFGYMFVLRFFLLNKGHLEAEE